jgi:hypothetical protein
MEEEGMHPQAFLQTFWRMELRPQVFVAMSFAPEYQDRFDKVIAPAVRFVRVGGVCLEPYRVDTSKSGDSILTDIVDGIAHCQMVLADVSTVGYDSKSGEAYRNANVMYEVGIALACRQSCEVLLVRDDHHGFLFDVSIVPHLTVDFTKTGEARALLIEKMVERLNERKHLLDARVELALATLTSGEAEIMKWFAENPHKVRGDPESGVMGIPQLLVWGRLFEKQLVVAVGEFEESGAVACRPTPLGWVVCRRLKAGMRKFKADKELEAQATGERKPEDVQPGKDVPETPKPGGVEENP